MKANELRIWNYVEFNGLPWKVSEIRSPKPLSNEYFANSFILELFDGGLIDVVIDDAFPIPLTEEWLLRFGFEQELYDNKKINWWNLPKENNYKAHHLMRMQNRWTWFIDFSDDEENPNCHLVKGFDFVHELQNLCQCLTGEELILR